LAGGADDARLALRATERPWRTADCKIRIDRRGREQPDPHAFQPRVAELLEPLLVRPANLLRVAHQGCRVSTEPRYAERRKRQARRPLRQLAVYRVNPAPRARVRPLPLGVVRDPGAERPFLC